MGKTTLLQRGEAFNPNEHTLIFTHIPKCGGTSIHRCLHTALDGRYRAFDGRSDYSHGLEGLLGAGGHQPFGRNPLHGRRKDLVYVTILRDPFDRFLSFYQHVQVDRRHYLRERHPELYRMAPLQFAQHLHAVCSDEAADLQTAMLCGRRDIEAAEAVAHIRSNYSIVGTLEKMEEFVSRLQELFPDRTIAVPQIDPARWLRLLKPHRRVRLNRSQEGELRAYIAAANERDCRVYAYFNSSTSPESSLTASTSTAATWL